MLYFSLKKSNCSLPQLVCKKYDILTVKVSVGELLCGCGVWPASNCKAKLRSEELSRDCVRSRLSGIDGVLGVVGRVFPQDGNGIFVGCSEVYDDICHGD